MRYTALTLISTFILLLCLCGKGGPSDFVTVASHGCNFTGYYIIDGLKTGILRGEDSHPDLFNDEFFGYKLDLENFKSVKVLLFKDSWDCSLNASVWVSHEEVATVNSEEGDGYNEITDTYNLAVAPLYYTKPNEPYEPTSDNEDEEDTGAYWD